MRTQRNALWMIAMAALALTAAACVETRPEEAQEATATTAQALGFDDDCDDLCSNVCSGDNTCGKSCNYWDEHPGSGSGSGSSPPYRHCRQTTCEAQVGIPCDDPPPEPCPENHYTCINGLSVYVSYYRSGSGPCQEEYSPTNEPCD